MRKKILINYIITILLSALITGALASYFIKDTYMKEKQEKLQTNISLIQNILEENYNMGEYLNYFKLSQEIMKKTNTRVSFIDIEGQPLADSINNSIIFKKIDKSEEFKNAINGEQDIVRRYSIEAGDVFFYLYSTPMKVEENMLIVRLGETYEDIDSIRENFLRYLMISTLIGVFIAILVAYISTSKMIKPIKELTKASKIIAQGDLSRNINVDAKDEIQELAYNFNIMRENINSNIVEMKNLENMRKDFVTNVSHELRTPLTSISGFVETLKTKELDEVNKIKALDIIDRETQRLKYLINELLILSKIESIKDTQFGRINVGECILSVIDLLNPQILSKSIQISYNIEDELNFLEGDSDLLIQLLINLIQNGIKYNNEYGLVHIEAKNLKEGIEIIVKDNGFGIPEEDKDRLFNRFYRVDKSRSSNIEGTGLGLSIVENIVHHLKGTIHFESELNKGSKFIVRLPK